MTAMGDFDSYWGRRDVGALCVDIPESFELHHVVEGLTSDDFIEIVRLYFGDHALAKVIRDNDGGLRYQADPFELLVWPVAGSWMERDYVSALRLRITVPATIAAEDALALNGSLLGAKVVRCDPVQLQAELMMGDGVMVGSVVGAIERLLLAAVTMLPAPDGMRPN